MTCEKCGSPSGACPGCCDPPDNSRFAEFRPHLRPFRRKKLFKTTKDFHAEVDRRLAEMAANNVTIWDVYLKGTT